MSNISNIHDEISRASERFPNLEIPSWQTEEVIIENTGDVSKNTGDVSNKKTEISEKISQLKKLLISTNGRLQWELSGRFQELAELELMEMNEKLTVSPGMKDVLLAEVSQLGHKDKFPRAYDWENILPTLKDEQELLWVIKKQGDSFKLYLGLKYNQFIIQNPHDVAHRKENFRVLCGGFARRAFPESSIKKLMVNDSSKHYADFFNFNTAYCVSGFPSYKNVETDKVIADRDEEKRPFASLNDIIESHLNIGDDFCIVFTVARASADDILKVFEDKFAIQDKIAPLISRDITENEGYARGENENTQDTWSEVTIQENVSIQEKEHLVDSLKRGFKNLFKGGTGTATFGRTKIQNGPQHSSGRGNHIDDNCSVSLKYTIKNSALKFLDDQLTESLNHLKQTPGTGGYYANAVVYANDHTIGLSIAQTIKATLSGSQSNLRPIQIMPLTGDIKFQLKNLPLHRILQAHRAMPEILNCEKASLFLLLPDADFPGVKLKKNVFYGRPEVKNNDSHEHYVTVGDVAFLCDPIEDESKRISHISPALNISSEDLCSHVFLVGTTGSGKTERAASILNNIPADIRVVVFETAKKTYRNLLQRNGKKPLIYTLGNSQLNPLRFNPFYFEEGTSLKQHIAILADAIADLLPMEALIGPKLREAIENAYTNCNWDIETSEPIDGSQKTLYPDMLIFNAEVDKICRTLSDYGPEVRSNYTGALKNRAGIFIDSVFQDIFAYDGNRTIDKLFPEDQDVIIEMEDMPKSEINLPSFILSILLHRIRAKQTAGLTRCTSEQEYWRDNKRFLLVIEEAHNVLAKKFEEKSDDRQSGRGGHLVNQVVRLLAEGRGLGIGIMVIDQSSNTIAPSVIANTNTKIVFRQEDGEEIKTIGTAIGLREDDWNDLQKLSTGECIVKSKSFFKPVKLARLPEPCKEYIYSEKDLFPSKQILAPYSKGTRVLTELFNRGLFLRREGKRVADELINICSANEELLRFIIGKHFIKNNQHDLLSLLSCSLDSTNITGILMYSFLPSEALIPTLLFIKFLSNWQQMTLSPEAQKEILCGWFKIESLLVEEKNHVNDVNIRDKIYRLCNVLKKLVSLQNTDFSCMEETLLEFKHLQTNPYINSILTDLTYSRVIKEHGV